MASTATDSLLFFIDDSAAAGRVPNVSVGVSQNPIKRLRKTRSRSRKTNIEAAVYAYIQAVRALNRTTVATNEIANALSIPINEIRPALISLKKKGVKLL